MKPHRFVTSEGGRRCEYEVEPPNEQLASRFCNLLEEEHLDYVKPEVVGTINIEPHWPSTLRWFAGALVSHSFDRGAKAPVASFMEQVRYLHATDPDELQRIIDELK